MKYSPSENQNDHLVYHRVGNVLKAGTQYQVDIEQSCSNAIIKDEYACIYLKLKYCRYLSKKRIWHCINV